jgi:NitT/TauT family transport system substrate-binding protein
MDCCSGTPFDPRATSSAEPVTVGRRGLFRIAPALATPFIAGSAHAAGKTITIGFCSNFLCAPPYLVPIEAECFKAEGLDAKIVYFRGSGPVVQALAAKGIDYAASTFEDVLQAANHGVALTRFLSTANTPLNALAVAPQRSTEITTAKHLEGKTVGIVAVGGPQEAWTRLLIKQAGGDPAKLRLVALGPNIFDAVRLGQVDAAWVGEPAHTLLSRQGSATIVDFMQTADVTRVFGGRYEFMGISVLREQAADRRDEMIALARAINKGLVEVQQRPPMDAIRSMPAAMLAGLDVPLLAEILEQRRAALYPTTAAIDVAACERNEATLRSLGLLKPEVTTQSLLDLTIAPA